ncbi:type VI secretion system baseplate subunit TssF [Marinibactrum halimedae]|uniref:Type VI secretion system protein ImpG n=1 Tax=Marinibactrum halimedae TaxID=1444977 RepID=A0AA37WM82_9GAMM|nr:type VI secretion system baseplate subunit TssF [Marinibactrum halimedae]MCD9458363.1 type VI secretion system baseplate subunit TssF [Marinibactrum halimedae]GLS26060.1 type VI secretion system protein ImpG [Marinibactrum halimedae]
MSDSLLHHYENELAFIQQTAAEFAKKHPAAASRLQLNEDTIEDPLVERLISGFAYLNARIQHKLTDGFPELTDAVLDTVYPHYLRPIPSMALVSFEPDPQLDKPEHVPKGTLLESDVFNGEKCRFTTCYDTDILPLKVHEAELMARPFIAPGSNDVPGAAAVLKIRLKALSPDVCIGEFGLKTLRLFLKGQSQFVYPTYDLLLTKTLKVVFAPSDDAEHPSFAGPELLSQVGLNAEDSLLPYPLQSFTGYRLLTEFFAFPEKFHFIDINGLDIHVDESYGDELCLYLYLKDSNTELEHQITAQSFALGCTPVVNLFEQDSDPIALSHHQYQYPVIADSRRRNQMEVYSVDKVTAHASDGSSTEYLPFYGVNHAMAGKESAYWFSQREPVVEGEHNNEMATEVNLSLVDLNFNPHLQKDQTLALKLTCSNRNLAKKLPTGNNQPYLTPVEGDLTVERIACLVSPTAAIRPPMRERSYWRLISHLNLNHLSLGNTPGSSDALKEILRLYDFKDSASTRKMIQAVLGLKTKSITSPIQVDGSIVMCRGTEVEFELDPILLSGTSPLLFASVLEKFCGLYCSINSFTKVTAKIHGKDGVLKRWPPRAGEKALL